MSSTDPRPGGGLLRAPWRPAGTLYLALLLAGPYDVASAQAAAVASATPRNAIAHTPSALAMPGPSPRRSDSEKIAFVIG